MDKYINVIGAGLAGSEAAWQIAKRGIKVRLYEMKPVKFSPAHKLETFAELVCSNSLRSSQIENAVGLLKEEMRRLDSIVLKCADKTSIPAGSALAVDREAFSKEITAKLELMDNVEIIRKEVNEIPNDSITIVAAGPLVSENLSESIRKIIGKDFLYFFDAAAPIVDYNTINMNIAFKASRYNKGNEDYINCPFTKEQYLEFYNTIISAECIQLKEFENSKLFEGCMPIEEMAKRGLDTIRYGPLKPVGIVNKHNGKEPYAVVQLRQDNSEGTLYNLVGFQTHLKWSEQKKVISLIPGLEKTEIVRYGVMHKNTYINSPKLLDETYYYKDNIYFAGQITGVEGYVESAASGLVAGINAVRFLNGLEKVIFPRETALGALANYICDRSKLNFQPMNINYGIIKSIDKKIKDKKDRKIFIGKRSLDIIKRMINI